MIKAKAFAKLNLNLHLFPEKDNNGFYPVKFVNCELDLHDELYFEKQKDKIDLICNNIELSNKNNLVYKTALLLKKVVGNNSLGVKITLKKNIPIKAGLGGGSSDAAVTLKTLIKMWCIKISNKQLSNIINLLGKDVFYCFKGRICEILNDGSKVIPLKNNLPKLFLLIITPEQKKPSTAWMYKHLDQKKIGKNLDKYFGLLEGIRENNRIKILLNLQNDFEDIAIDKFPIIKEIKNDMKYNNAVNTLLSGSGLSVVGFFDNKGLLENAFNNLKDKNTHTIWTYTR